MNFIEEYQLSDPGISDDYVELFKKANAAGITKPGVTAKGLNPAVKQSTDFILDEADRIGAPFSLWERYYKELWNFVQDYITKYRFMEFGGRFDMKFLPVIQYYRPGEGFKVWHIDAAQKEQCDRAMVYITYLNDVPNGGTMFYHQNYKTIAQRGKTIIFLAGYTHLHKGEISQTHEKYILTGWIWWD